MQDKRRYVIYLLLFLFLSIYSLDRAMMGVVGSTIARETDAGVYLHAGPEIGVASTKAFTCQCVVLTMLSLFIGRRKFMSQAQSQELIDGLCETPEKIEKVLQQNDVTRDIARHVSEATTGTGRVAHDIGAVSRGASETGAASTQVLSSAQALASESRRLKAAMDQFLGTMRVA